MKRFTAVLLIAVMLLSLCACTAEQKSDRPQIIATLFPQYDFARAIVGDTADVTLLISPGTETHSFDPSARDMVKLRECDAVLYTGDESEPWVPSLLKGNDGDFAVIDVSDGIELIDLDDHDDEHTHHHNTDPHIWTSPVNAIKMIENICSALCELYPEHEAVYRQNAESYIEKLKELDSDIRTVINSAKRREIVCGGEFALLYFATEYGLRYTAAYDSCGGESEPSPRRVAQIIDKINEDNISVIYYGELSNTAVADTIAADTGAEALLLHSCHNVTREDFENGATYLSLMRQNLENLEKGLN
ncbi:MAG: zinc ABC transporter substrate-binding protein [Oscillospiraceae bacterium]|nr:zinc ABC transporter substrate-binding protein [Oscillospiraceae bacterium]